MFIINKYKSPLNLDFESINFLPQEINKTKNINSLNYIFLHRSNFVRSFMFFYSVFLMTNQFSFIKQQNKPEFVTKINVNSILIINNDYNNFFRA